MKNLDPYWIEINRLENEADQLYRRLLAKLFDGTFDAITVMKLKEIAEQLEAAADAFEDVANSDRDDRHQGVLSCVVRVDRDRPRRAGLRLHERVP